MQTLFGAFAFLTRLPVPNHKCFTHNTIWAFPIVGAMVGAFSALAYYGALWLNLPTMVGATFVVLIHCLLTGGLHYDGLADVADGLWGASTKEKRLKIMKDSRVGSYGVIALILIILIKIQIISAIGDVYMVGYALVITGALSRSVIGVMHATLPPAKTDGLMVSCGTPSILQAVACGIIGLIVSYAFSDIHTVIYLALASAISITGLFSILYKKIGGITGDCLGASQVLSEIIFLIVLYTFLNMEKIGLGVL